MSKVNFESELSNPGILGGCDRSKPSGIHAQCRIVEVRPVEDVEELGPKLQPITFGDQEILEDSDVPVYKTRAAEAALTDVAESSGCGEAERRRNQPVYTGCTVVACSRSIWLTHEIRAIQADTRT